MKILLLVLLLGVSPDREIINLTNKVVELKRELSQTQHNLLKMKKVERVITFYTNSGTFKHWGLLAEYIELWFTVADKYKYLAGREGNINMSDYMVALIHAESNGIADIVVKEKDGTYSYGITQINVKCIKEIETELNKLCPELRWRDIRTDIEKNIAGRFLWVHHRRERGWSWAMPDTSNGWKLYAQLKSVN